MNGPVVIVCGSRDWNLTGIIGHALREARPSLIVHGGCSGADAIAGNWACAYDVPVKVYAADWDALGRAAGPMRNQRMVDAHPGALVLAFHRRNSRGTADTIRRAKKAGLRVIVFREDGTKEEAP